ncbi:lpxB [Scenedesmus sp. PABB004]|nr:lpxB [Scenedesmus sp. PABB004]
MRAAGARAAPAGALVTRTLSTALKGPLSLFVCAADEQADRAGAALVASLKELHGAVVQIYGVGGPALRAQGLHRVVSDEQQAALEAGEVVQLQAGGSLGRLALPGVALGSRQEYLRVFRDAVWDAALAGCGSRDKPGAAPPRPAAAQPPPPGGAPPPLPRGLAYDAVLTVASPTASHQLLFGLRKAQEARVARLPACVHYLPPGLWDAQQTAAAAATWAKLADHVMCGLPFEPALLHAAGGPASFVGSPALQPLLQAGSFGGRGRLVAELLAQRGAGGAAPVGQLFGLGNAAAFWRHYDAVQGRAEAAGAGAATGAGAAPGTRKRRAQPAPAAGAGDGDAGGARRLLLLLPGGDEGEVRASMRAFDAISGDLAASLPGGVAAAMLVPDLLVEAAYEATNNFALRPLVLPAGHTMAANALAAGAAGGAALAHPGPESLRAAAAGVPLVCARDGSLLREGLAAWRHAAVLPAGCVPNLALGRRAVPEFGLWSRGAQAGAVAALAALLAPGPAAAAARAEQRAVLQDLLLALVPPQRRPAGAAAAAGGGVQSPSEAAAATVLELIALRRAQEAEQRGAALAPHGVDGAA